MTYNDFINHENDKLNIFRGIAAQCTEDECLEIIADCLDSSDPFMRGSVCDLYRNRLKQLQNLESEIEHYESVYQG